MFTSFCSKCGEKLSEDAYFCPKCGVKTRKGVEAGVSTPSEDLREAFAKVGEEMEKAFATAAKEIQKAFKTARENVTESVAKEKIVCPHCGGKNRANSKFCYHCGKKLQK
jgi:uncharacterized membrane protein YvbJ